MSAEPSLSERIRTLRELADAFLDEKASELSLTTPGVPLQVLRNLLTNRAYGCQCLAVLKVLNNTEGRPVSTCD